jgi:predicted transcriptional regulator of viral defense system
MGANMANSLAKARTRIRPILRAEKEGVFKIARLRSLFAEHKEAWGLNKDVTVSEFIEYLLKRKEIQQVELRSELYKPLVRYALRKYSPHLMALSLRPRSYLSHGTAVFLHALNDQLPKTIYANQEQTEKPSGGSLSQEGLTRAFSGRQRTSRYVYSLEGGYRIVLLSGKQTKNLGVKNSLGPKGEDLPVTEIARTLIDIAVRPAYAGGIVQVLEAYRGAKDRVEAKEIVQTLQRLAYVYPYHQAVGFLMERAGFASKEYEKLLKLGTEFDFYLVHGMKKPSFDKKWRLFFPEGF